MEIDNVNIKTLKEVSKELNLDFTSDWGIINQDVDRVKEFIVYFNKNKDLLDSGTQLDYIELVIASFNEALVENKVDNELEFLFKEFIYPHISVEDYDPFSCFRAVVYWMTLDNERGEFPVRLMLEQMMGVDE